MFELFLVIMYGIMVGEGYFAYLIGFFSPGQERLPIPPGVHILTFVQHGGMLGDIIISWLTAHLAAKYFHEWNRVSIIQATLTSAVAFAIICETWRRGSVHVYDFCVINRKIMPAGWLHYVYGVIALTVIILALFYTPKEVLRSEISLIVILLMIHIGLGTFLPEWVSQKKISAASIVPACSLWVALIAKYWQIAR
jgi:hypothetical protein